MTKNVSKTTQSIPTTDTSVKNLTKADLVRIGWSSAYIEKALTHGWLVGIKVAVPGREKTVRWEVTEEDYQIWRNTRRQAKSGFSGTSAEMASLDEYLKAAKPEQIAAIRRSLEAATK